MSFVGKNIRKIRSLKGYSQAAFSELFGITRASVGAYEEGRAEPKIDLVIKIANHFSLSVEMLLTKELTVNELSRFDIFRTAVAGGGKGQRVRAVAPEPDRHAMRLVGVAEEQAYLEHHADEHYLAGLPLVNMPPQLASGSRIFELKGQEMQAAGQGFFPGDWLVCQPVPQKQWSNLPEGHAYMVVTVEGISCRRVYRKGKKFELHAANAQYPPRALSVQDTLEVWKVGHRITTALEEAPDHLEQRIIRLEEQVRGLMALRDSTSGT